jgi:hypothetical protein
VRPFPISNTWAIPGLWADAGERVPGTRSPDHGYLVEEVDHLLGPRLAAQVTMDDDAVEAVVYKDQQAGIQLCKKLHGSSLLRSCVDNSIIGQTAGGIKISNMFG